VPACDGRTDGRTDGQTDVKPIAITCFSIADARNKMGTVAQVTNGYRSPGYKMGTVAQVTNGYHSLGYKMGTVAQVTKRVP